MIHSLQDALAPSTFAGLGIGLLAFVIVLLVVPCIVALASSCRMRERQLHHTHKSAIPRLGGLALVTAFTVISLVAMFVLDPNVEKLQSRVTLVVTALAMFGLGCWDDLSPLGAKKKLFGQVLIALAAFHFGMRIESFRSPLSGEVYMLGMWAMPATVLWLVVLTNLINLVDGIDGLAAGISLMLMCLLVYVGFHGHSFSLFISIGMAGALIAFLNYNFPPARIYMGDGGAYFLGYLIGALTIHNSNKGTVLAALIAPVIALALPILDVTVSIVRRALKGLPLFRPDRRHIHHRLLQAGFSRRRAVLTLYGISLIFLCIGFVAFWSRGKMAPILFGCVFLVLLVITPSLGIIKNWLTVGTTLGNSLEMRKEVQYALLLRNWLTMEAERTDSVDQLWNDLQFMARKIGFTQLDISTGDQSRGWRCDDANDLSGLHYVRHELQINGEPVAFEFRAKAAEMNEKLFQILSELVTEAWQHASVRWRESRQRPFAFVEVPRPLPQPSA